MTFRQAAAVVLREVGPSRCADLAQEILKRGLVATQGRTPQATLGAQLAVEIKRNGEKSQFVRLRPGVFGLRELHGHHVTGAHGLDASEGGFAGGPDGEGGSWVRTPAYPVYAKLRHVLRVWPGRPRTVVTGLRGSLIQLTGTPQDPVDWSDPDRWINERLEGEERDLALAIWAESKGTANPRHVYGHWILAQAHGLIAENGEGLLELTQMGRSFLEEEGGDAEVFLDDVEGLLKVLALVAESGPARPGELVEDWGEYLSKCSSFGSTSTIRSTLAYRLKNLLARGLVLRKGTMYSATDAGIAYLERTGSGDGEGQSDLWALAKKEESSVRDSMRELLLDMDAYAFEYLVKRLLEEMGYQNVEVTQRGGDGGVDVIGEIELGITSVREVVQAKRHRKTIQRKDLDALRGSLYRFDAVRGTIVTTSKFTSGVQKAAFERGAAPITLIDGDKLVDLLIQYGIGVRKRTLEVLAIDADAFADLGEDD